MNANRAASGAALIDLTQQRRRLYLSGGAIVVSFIVIVAAPFLLSSDFAAATVSFGIGALVLCAASLYLFRSLRCPRCNLPLLQYSISHVAYGNWLSWLLELNECPQCGYPRSEVLKVPERP